MKYFQGPLSNALIAVFLLAYPVTGQTAGTPQSATTSPTSQSDAPVFRANSRLVVVDVVATRHDRVVEGLKAKNFTILEDGKPQKLVAFEPHIFADRKPPIPRMQLPPNQFSNFPAVEDPGPVNVILFDLLNTYVLDQAYARKQMIEFLKQLPPGHRLALFVLGTKLKMIQGFTETSQTLAAAAESLHTTQSPLVTSEEDRLTEEWVGSALASGGMSDRLVAATSARIQEAIDTEIKTQEIQRVEGTLNALSVLASAVSGYPGRKNLMWLSSNFPFRFGPQTDNYRVRSQRQYLNPFQGVSALLETAQISVYPIDISGISTDGLGRVSIPGDGNSSIINREILNRWDTHDAMADIARETGGRPYYGSNDFKDLMQRSLHQGENYYSLAYVPSNTNWNGKYRKIEVKLTLDDVRLEYRRGYYSLAGTEINKSQNIPLLAAAMQPSVPECTMLLMRVQVLPPDQGHKNVTIDYAVAPADVSFPEGDDHLKHAQLDFMASAWEGDKEIAHVVTPIDFHIRKEMYEEVNRAGIPGHQELELKPGTYLLRVGVMDRDTLKIGTVNVPLTIPAERASK